MPQNPIRSIVIVGGGTAGWMAAASFAKHLEKLNCSIRLIESEQIGTVGVGEATIPPIIDFIRLLGINENDIVCAVKGTFKLGIAYRNWTRPGDYFFHPFGPTGFGMGPISFPSYWLKMFLDSRAERLELQQHLARHGFDVGEPSGRLGLKTRAAGRDFQARSGLVPAGFATAAILERLRAN
jgi:tryptophan halogenase